MSLNNYLTSLYSELVIKDSEKDSINISISTIQSRLNSYFGNEIKEQFKFGSYTRGTILPRKVDENSDIDYMVVFDNSYNYIPQTFLNKLKKFAEDRYYSSEIHQSSPTIVLELNHIKFELVPAFKDILGNYNIPDKNGGWMFTSPKSFDDKLVNTNKNNYYMIKPVIRLLKYWNILKNYRSFSSFELEKTIADKMEYAYFYSSGYEIIDYLKDSFDILQDTLYSWDNSYDRINKAITVINDAKRLEDYGLSYKALEKIKQILPEI